MKVNSAKALIVAIVDLIFPAILKRANVFRLAFGPLIIVGSVYSLAHKAHIAIFATPRVACHRHRLASKDMNFRTAAACQFATRA